MKIVKCKRCGTEYEMPDIGVDVVMEDCPVCKELDAMMKKAGFKP
jgi:hypothetical protein